MSFKYKNSIRLKRKATGIERRKNLVKEVVKDSTPILKPIEHKDIDIEFQRWVEEELSISFEGKRLPTVALFSNQRFSEYMQSWQNVDDTKNFVPNFKIVTRESNPKNGSIWGDTRNIPNDHMIKYKTVEARDKNDRKYYIDYFMKQPIALDFLYSLSIVTNKYELLNDFNRLMNDKFKSINCYIRPKGHYMPMKLTDISDDSSYSIDNRQYYSQTYSITVMAYIIPEDSFVVRERPEMKFVGFEGERRGETVIEEMPVCDNTPEYQYVPAKITIEVEDCQTGQKFTMDTDFEVETFETINVRYFRMFVNDTEVILEKGLRMRKNDTVKIKGLVRYHAFKKSVIIINGFSFSEIEPTEE